MPIAADMVGARYGRLTVIFFRRLNGGKYTSECICDCGVTKEVRTSDLRAGKTGSCGCLHREIVANLGKKATHGHTRFRRPSPEYVSWQAMISRCYNAKHKHYGLYGGRGIRVCKAWRDDFQAFLNDMGVRPGRNYSIDRKGNNGNYKPSNCRWVDRHQQAGNQSSTIKVEVHGALVSLKAAARILGVPYPTVQYRRRTRGMSPEQALGLVDSLGRPDVEQREAA